VRKKTKAKPTMKAKPTWAGRWKRAAKAVIRRPAVQPRSADAREELERRRRINAEGEAIRRARARALGLGDDAPDIDVPFDWLQPRRKS
jgi:hypothetical protein